MFKIIKMCASRSMFFYLAVIICSFLVVDYDVITTGGMIRSGRFLDPAAYNDLMYFADNGQKADKKALKTYLFYYKRYVEYVPDGPDAYSMLGFCSYYSGKHGKAINAYKKAVMLNDDSFWPYYDLALIFFKRGDYKASIKLCESAVGKDPKYTLRQYLGSRKIFLPIIINKGLDVDSILKGLRDGYRDCYVLLISANNMLKDYDGMLVAAKNAVKANVGDAYGFYYYEGVALYYLKRYKEAVTMLNKSIEFARENPDAYHYLSLSFRAIGLNDLETDAKEKKQLYGKHNITPGVNGLRLRFY